MKVLDVENKTILLLGLLFFITKKGRGYHIEFIDDLNQERTELDLLIMEVMG